MSVETLFLTVCAVPIVLSVVLLDVEFFPGVTDDAFTDVVLAISATFLAYVALRIVYKAVALVSSGLPVGVQTTAVCSVAVGLLFGLLQQDIVAGALLNLVKQRIRDDARRWWEANSEEIVGMGPYALRVAAVLFLWQLFILILYSATVLPLRVILGMIGVGKEAQPKADEGGVQEMAALKEGQLGQEAEGPDNLKEAREQEGEQKTNPEPSVKVE